MTAELQSGAVVLSDDLKNPAMEKLDLVRKWSINTYKVISVLDFLFMSLLYFCLILQYLLIRMLVECHLVFLFLLAYIQTLHSQLPIVLLINKPLVLCSVLGKSCPRSWVVVRGLWTWSWRHRSKSCAITRESTKMWSSWLRLFPVSCLRSCRHRGSWAMPSLTSASSHQSFMWVLMCSSSTDYAGLLWKNVSLLFGYFWFNEAWDDRAHRLNLDVLFSRRSLVTMLTPKGFYPKMERHCWVPSTSSSPV